LGANLFIPRATLSLAGDCDVRGHGAHLPFSAWRFGEEVAHIGRSTNDFCECILFPMRSSGG
jgi:hypothetical protein